VRYRWKGRRKNQGRRYLRALLEARRRPNLKRFLLTPCLSWRWGRAGERVPAVAWAISLRLHDVGAFGVAFCKGIGRIPEMGLHCAKMLVVEIAHCPGEGTRGDYWKPTVTTVTSSWMDPIVNCRTAWRTRSPVSLGEAP